jgi:hypothetical protein
MLYLFRVSNNKLTANALVVTIQASSADEAWGKFEMQERDNWKNVKLDYIGGQDKVLPSRSRVHNADNNNRDRVDRPTVRSRNSG